MIRVESKFELRRKEGIDIPKVLSSEIEKIKKVKEKQSEELRLLITNVDANNLDFKRLRRALNLTNNIENHLKNIILLLKAEKADFENQNLRKNAELIESLNAEILKYEDEKIKNEHDINYIESMLGDDEDEQ